MNSSRLLIFDAAINLILGILLLLTIPFPDQLPTSLGVPAVGHAFYTSILGSVLIGIGIALIMESKRTNHRQLIGLGLGGAIVINLCAGTILIGWLIFGDLQLPATGLGFLWIIALLLIIISGFELITHKRRIESPS